MHHGSQSALGCLRQILDVCLDEFGSDIVEKWRTSTRLFERSARCSTIHLHSIMLKRVLAAPRTGLVNVRQKVTGQAVSRRQVHTPPTPQAEQAVTSSGRVRKYLPRLQDLSKRTGVPLPSLAISFLVLHEVTAVLPVIGFYYLFSALGIGFTIIQWLDRTTGDNGNEDTRGWKGVVKGWYAEAQGKIDRVGKRYGWWQDSADGTIATATGSSRAGEGVANAISAYVVVKVCLHL